MKPLIILGRGLDMWVIMMAEMEMKGPLNNRNDIELTRVVSTDAYNFDKKRRRKWIFARLYKSWFVFNFYR